MKKISIDELNGHMFEAIEMLKANKDPNADEHEKIDVETAKAIASLGKVAVDGFKVKAQVLGMMKNSENPNLMEKASAAAGIISVDNPQKQIEQ